jgi:hypothetical protein
VSAIDSSGAWELPHEFRRMQNGSEAHRMVVAPDLPGGQRKKA